MLAARKLSARWKTSSISRDDGVERVMFTPATATNCQKVIGHDGRQEMHGERIRLLKSSAAGWTCSVPRRRGMPASIAHKGDRAAETRGESQPRNVRNIWESGMYNILQLQLCIIQGHGSSDEAGTIIAQRACLLMISRSLNQLHLVLRSSLSSSMFSLLSRQHTVSTC